MSSLGGYTSSKGLPGGNNRGNVGRTIAGVFSGAAANIKSRFSNINNGNNLPQTNSTLPERSSVIITPDSNTPVTKQNGNLQKPITTERSIPISETFPSLNSSYHQNPYHHQNNHRWSETTVGTFANNTSVGQLAPNAIPITVPGADQNVSTGSDTPNTAFSSSSYVPKSVQTLSHAASQSPSHAFGMCFD